MSVNQLHEQDVSYGAKEQEVFRVAHELYTQRPDWVTFFREVLGLGGLVRQAYKDPDDLAAFEKTAAYAEIQAMVAKLREQQRSVAKTEKREEEEPTRVITVRLPKSLHESLRAEAHFRQTSMNKLCISKLLQVVDEELVPTDTPARSKRSPDAVVDLADEAEAFDSAHGE